MSTSSGSVEVSVVVSAASSILVFVLAGYMTLIKAIWGSKEKEFERRLGEIDKKAVEAEKTTVKVHEQELKNLSLANEIALLKQDHAGSKDDIDEIKKQQVPRAEWEKEMTNIRRQLETILARMGGSRYSTGHSSGDDFPSAKK